MSQSEILEKIYADFAWSMKRAAEETIGELVGTYLPYAESDLEVNVASYSKNIINDFLTDKNTYHWMDTEDIFKHLNSKDVRKKLIEEYADILRDDVVEDMEVEMKQLKEHIKWLESLVDSYRARLF